MTPVIAAQKRIALALSFANLVYLRVWFDLLGSPSGSFHTKLVHGPRDYWAVLTSVTMLAGAAWILLRRSSNLPLWMKKVLSLAGVALVGNALRAVAFVHTLAPLYLFRGASGKSIVIGSCALLLVGGVLAFRYFTIAAGVFESGLLMCLPAAVVTFAMALGRIASASAAAPDPPLAAVQRGTPGTRVMWVIFDEWDYRLSFEARPKGVELPVVDGLAARSLVGTRVLGPQGRRAVPEMTTAVAVPSLLAGALRGRDDFAGPNLLATAHSRGWNVAVAGWYFPYCRLFAQDAFRCYWDERYTQSTLRAESYGEALLVQSRSLFETTMLSLFGQPVASKRHAEEYRALLQAVLDAEGDERVGLLFAHFNIPHIPYFYDATRVRFDAAGRGVSGYGDALMLMDQTVGRILEQLDSQTVLILSADHPLRTADGDSRVPFLIHWPQQTRGLKEEREFSSIQTAELILRILEGRVSSPEEAARFLTGRGVAKP